MKPSRPGSLQPVQQTIRCAVYCRQSVEEKNKNGFGSLDAQREAGEKYISLYPEKGWELIPTRYEDAGISGGTLERPALKQLRADIAAGLIDAVIVYRSDRISRSIRDFLELMEEFERCGCAFVSVSEQFDTSTPGGRMHRNMLLTFAQYERELIAERTRDKVWAARRKGRFTGGQLPLGYDRHPDGGRLVANEVEAKRVRKIFRQFLDSGSIIETVQELNRRGWTLKRWTTKAGREYGGGAFDVHSLRRLLTNHGYVGEVLFQGEVFPAEHDAIVDRDTFDRVQDLIANEKKTPRRRSSTVAYLLAGRLRCAACDKSMTPSYSQKGNGRRYRYYVCQGAHTRGWKSCPSPSIPANQIEAFVVEKLAAIGSDPALVAATTKQVRRHLDEEKRRLADEARHIEKDLQRAHDALRQNITAASSRPARSRSARGSDTADIDGLEERLEQVRQELGALEASRIDIRDLRAALAQFTPIWAQLTSVEQARIMQLLIERIDYHGGTGNLGITFSAAGVTLLAQETPS